MLTNFRGVELNVKRLYQISGKEKESRLVFTSSTKRDTRHFHVAVVQRRQRNVQKSDARPKLLFCQSKPIAFLPSSLPSPSSLFKLPNQSMRERFFLDNQSMRERCWPGQRAQLCSYINAR